MAFPWTVPEKLPAKMLPSRNGANLANAAWASASVVSLPRPCSTVRPASSALMSMALIMSSSSENADTDSAPLEGGQYLAGPQQLVDAENSALLWLGAWCCKERLGEDEGCLASRPSPLRGTDGR